MGEGAKKDGHTARSRTDPQDARRRLLPVPTVNFKTFRTHSAKNDIRGESSRTAVTSSVGRARPGIVGIGRFMSQRSVEFKSTPAEQLPIAYASEWNVAFSNPTERMVGNRSFHTPRISHRKKRRRLRVEIRMPERHGSFSRNRPGGMGKEGMGLMAKSQRVFGIRGGDDQIAASSPPPLPSGTPSLYKIMMGEAKVVMRIMKPVSKRETIYFLKRNGKDDENNDEEDDNASVDSETTVGSIAGFDTVVDDDGNQWKDKSLR